ncbi:L,D-transpeptidase family protein [Shimazuella sp. AN120528]|uniref:L,D-transpeptidase family protein n=1 Tax=Shimazuella soli TaxID=1892854 RepID=UPI001F0E7CCD|nr:L,D-transpeptidase family protein [Shimazuella soli]MCH5583841.1 L,D-transpeptidase family protein [Shimazuella soli]
MKAVKWMSILTALALVFTVLAGFGAANSSYAAGGPDDYKIEINKTTNYLYLYNKYGKVIKTYRVATGKTKALTPEGTFEIIIKINQPGWKGIPGGDPRNPLGPRWLGLQVGGDNGRTYGIHGTNQPSSIGTHASHGCVRMYSNQVIELYNTVGTGTLVWIHTGKSDGIWHGKHRTSKPSPAGKLTVSVSAANIRAAASLKAKVLQVVPRGTVLNKVGVVGDFYKIKLKSGAYAYVHKSVVR